MEFLDEMGKVFFESIAKSTNAYLYVIQGDTNLTRWSQNAVDNFELSGEYMYDMVKDWYQLVHPDDLLALKKDLDEVFQGQKDSHHCEYRVRKRTGEYIWIRCRGYATRKEDGSLAWFIGLIHELASRNKVDYITQLLSIYEFRRNLEMFLNSGMREAGVLLLGVDNFKKINTMYSYSIGNQVLMKVAQAFRNLWQPHAELYRIEGDKFAFVCPHYSKKEMIQLFKDAQDAITELELQEGETVKLTISGGALMLDDNEYQSVDVIHKDLEHALSVSKQNHAGSLTFFSEELLEESMRQLRLQEELRRCVENNFEGFELYFQPIMKAGTTQLYSCEALLRWKNQKFPNTYPDQFIPILEATGLIIPVGKWVGAQALTYLKAWRQRVPDLKVNINVSYVQILEGGLQDHVAETLKIMEMPPDSIVVEITESCDVKDVDNTIKFVKDIRNMGIEIALDDFGTGYSSISVLQQIPTDWVKLDHNYVCKIKDNEFDRNIVQYLISLCHSLGYKVCVEGVEDDMCYQLIQAQDAEAVQGYYFSRPVPAEDFYKKYIDIPCN